MKYVKLFWYELIGIMFFSMCTWFGFFGALGMFHLRLSIGTYWICACIGMAIVAVTLWVCANSLAQVCHICSGITFCNMLDEYIQKKNTEHTGGTEA